MQSYEELRRPERNILTHYSFIGRKKRRLYDASVRAGESRLYERS